MEPVDNVTVEQRLAAIEEKLDLVLARLGMTAGVQDAVVQDAVVRDAVVPPAMWPQAVPAQDDEVLELVRRGKKIQAIKVYRERTGAGLREAKDAIDAMSDAERFRLGRR